MLFQSTRPRGARHAFAAWGQQIHACFNPRAHAGRDPSGAGVPCDIQQFQSTRPRGARHTISHTPFPGWFLFQSTRPRGARQVVGGVDRLAEQRFNPRAHAGRDVLEAIRRLPDEKFQSTRPRGARRGCGLRRGRCRASFNPRAHAGRDAGWIAGSCGRTGFNPRAHAGRDVQWGVATAYGPGVSIHAPTRGATGQFMGGGS